MTLSSSSLVAETGPIPINSGGQPVTAPPTIVDIGSSECCLAKLSLQTIAMTAPSVRGEEVAAVTEPFSMNAGDSLDIDSNVVDGLIHPSESISMPSWLMLTISSSKCPLSRANVALLWDSRAKLSCSNRDTENSFATFSAVIPIFM